MANESTHLSTADLRRRLLAPSALVAAPAEPVAAHAPALSAHFAHLARRPVVPASLADLPLAEDEPTYPIDDLADLALADPTLVPLNNGTPTDLRRPAGRSSFQLTRPVVAPHPPADPLIEQLRREAEVYRHEGQHLQQLMEEMRQLLQDASDQEHRMQEEVADRELKLEAAELRIAELETLVNTKPKTKTELEIWADDLERESMQIAQERRTMDKDRTQLRDDEAALEKQMREMEVGMARERALLARQEQELKRLNAEIQHELEVMQRGDGVLRDRLAVFQRRHAEVVSGEPPAPVHGSFYGTSPVAQSMSPTPPRKNDTTGLLRKLFRSGE